MKFIWKETVSDVEEKSLVVGGKIGADGKTELFTETAGWYIRIDQIAFWVGNEKPPFKKGDRVQITIEHEKEN